MPAGVTGNWAANVVTISGTPSASGNFNYTITLTGGCGTITATGVITVTPNNTITLTSAAGTNNQTVCINTAITNITYSTTGATGATFSGLPAGVTGNWASNNVTITGTPSVSGSYPYTITLTGGCGTVTATGTINVTPNNTITLTSGNNTQTVCINSAIASITYSTTGATGATFSGLPAGVTGNWAANTVTISGTPSASGTFNYTVTLTGGCGTVTATGTITVTPNNIITLTSANNTQTVCINTAIANITYTTTGATGATFGGLPAGVTGNWAANAITISGTPTASGSFPYTITLTGGCGTVTATGTITVTPNNTITLTSAAGTNNQTRCINTAITSITYGTTGATGATFSGLPAGVTGTWAANVATISGTPTVSGTFNYTVTLTGGCGTITATGTITVTPNNTITLATGNNVQTVCVNTPIVTTTYTTTGAAGATFSGLPAGVTGSWAANTVTISGTPTASGTFNFTITLTGGCGTVTSTGTLNVTPNNTITLTSGNNNQSVCVSSALVNITYNTTGATGATFSGLPAGITGGWAANVITISGTPTSSGIFPYTITLIGGCGTITATGTITVNSLPTPTASNAGPYCVGGTIELSSLPAGMTSYQWSGPQSYSAGTQNPSIPSATTLMAGTYTVTVTNSNNCTATASTIVVVNPLPTPYNVVGGGSYCAGGTGVVVGLDNSQFNTTYTLYLNGVSTGTTTLGTGGPISFGSQTAAGVYTVVASNNASYCTNNMTGSATIVVNPLPTVSAGANQSIPNGTSATLDGSASGGSGNYSFAWTPAGSLVNPSIEDPTTTILTITTTYTLVVTDLTTGCQNSSQTVVSIVGGPLTAAPTASPNPICLGQSTQLNANATGGSNNYTYSWSSSPAGFTSTLENPTVSPAVTTNYTVTVSDGFTTTTSSVSVTVYPLPQQYEVSGGGSYCSGGTGLNVVLSGSQIGIDYQLVLNGGNTGTPQSGTSAGLVWTGQTGGGTYTVVATNNATGCSNLMAGSAVININNLPFAYDVTGGGQFCSGGTGVIVGLSGSEANIQYQLLINGSGAGAPVSGTGSAMDFGLQTTPGNYTVIAISPAMCNNNMNGNAVITVNPLPGTFNVTGGGNYCNGGTGLPVGLNGSATGINYQLQYNGSNEGMPLPGTGAALDFGSFVNAGTYSVIATDNTTNCNSNMTNTVTIVIDPLPFVYNVTGGGAYCSGGTGLSAALVTAEPGITYTLYLDGVSTGLTQAGNIGGVSFDNLTAAGTYTIQGVNNSTTCISDMSGSVTISVNPLPVIDSLYIHPLTSCVSNNGEITVYATGALPLQYSIDSITFGTDSVFISLPSGSFIVYVQDVNGCMNSLTDVIPNNTGFAIDSILTVNLLCNGDSSGQISVFAAGGTWFSIDNGVTLVSDSIFTGLAAGSYIATAMDDGGCNQAQTVNVLQPPVLEGTTVISDVSCNGLQDGIAEISISGGTPGYTYLWDDTGASDSSEVTGLSSGIYYHVTVTDANGCMLVDSVITDQPDVLLTAMNAADVLCNGGNNGQADVTVTGGTTPYFYVWDNPGLSVGASVSDLLAGIQYFVTITDDNGCTAVDSVMVNEPAALTMTHIVTQATCGSSDGVIELTVSGGTSPYAYLWDNTATTPVITGLGAGNYTVTVTDNNGCTVSGTYTIINMNAGAIQVTGITNVLCFGDTTGSISVAVTGGTADFTYIWSTGDTLVTSSATAMLTGLIPGSYSVTVEDANGCISDTSVNVIGPAAGLLPGVSITDITCFGMADGILIASATGGQPPYTYLWSNSMTGAVLTNMTAGNYTLTITDNNGCQFVEDSIVLTEPTLLRVFTNPDSPACFGDATGSGTASVTGGTSPYTFAWSNQMTDQTIINIPAGQYIVTVTDQHGCTAISVMNVSQPLPIVVSHETGTDVATHAGYIDLTVSGGGLPYTYFWSNNELTEDINNLTGGWYIYTITDANTCQISDSIYVALELGIPNTITPNGDGKNDDFFIINIEAYEKVVIMIYSQWNELLYLFEGTGVEYNQTGTRFDGMFNGRKLPMGAYLYIITIGDEDVYNGALLIKY
jgi:gliding motility-associated-like protein